jgi:hypothetical protein
MRGCLGQLSCDDRRAAVGAHERTSTEEQRVTAGMDGDFDGARHRAPRDDTMTLRKAGTISHCLTNEEIVERFAGYDASEQRIRGYSGKRA